VPRVGGITHLAAGRRLPHRGADDSRDHGRMWELRFGCGSRGVIMRLEAQFRGTSSGSALAGVDCASSLVRSSKSRTGITSCVNFSGARVTPRRHHTNGRTSTWAGNKSLGPHRSNSTHAPNTAPERTTYGCETSIRTSRSSPSFMDTVSRITTAVRIGTKATASISLRCHWLVWAVSAGANTPPRSSRSCDRWPPVDTVGRPVARLLDDGWTVEGDTNVHAPCVQR